MVRLLNPKTARAFYDWMMGFWAFASLIVGDVNLDRFQRWLWGTPQEQQQVSQEAPCLDQTIEALFVVYQKQKDTQFEVMALKSEIGKLPALPEERF
jgi:hypothetical protein